MIKKLNNKGYLLVEIIVSFVIAMGVAYFLAEITINLKNRQEDLDHQIQYNVDKALITKELMDDYGKIKDVTGSGTNYTVTLLDDTTKNLSINQSGGLTTFTYGDYTKTFDKSLTIDNININNDTTNKILKINLSAKNIYSEKDYGLNIIIPYSENGHIPMDTPTPSVDTYTITLIDDSNNIRDVNYTDNKLENSDLPETKEHYNFEGYYNVEYSQVTREISVDEESYSGYIFANNAFEMLGTHSIISTYGSSDTFVCANNECTEIIKIGSVSSIYGNYDYFSVSGTLISPSEDVYIYEDGTTNTSFTIGSGFTLIANWRYIG